MLRLSVGALRTRWQLFAGAVVAVALGVGLVLSGLQMLAATDRPVLPAGLSAFERAKVREGYVGAATLLGNRIHAIVQATSPVHDDELRAHLADRLVRYKIPRTFEYVAEPLRDDAGKIRRSALRAERLP